jgi:hypothetical protein
MREFIFGENRGDYLTILDQLEIRKLIHHTRILRLP